MPLAIRIQFIMDMQVQSLSNICRNILHSMNLVSVELSHLYFFTWLVVLYSPQAPFLKHAGFKY